MTAQIRFVLLVLVLAYSVAFGAGQSPAAAKKRGAHSHRLKESRHRGRRVRRTIASADTVGTRVVQFARRLLGTPYRYGGESPSGGFDCSGFVRFVYAHFGVALPHSSYADFGLGTPVSRGALRPGDLVFFDGVGHVGMYVGGGRFIHAPHSGTVVQVTSLSEPWYRSSFDGARRLVRPARLIVPPARRIVHRAAARVRRGDSWRFAVRDSAPLFRVPAPDRSNS